MSTLKYCVQCTDRNTNKIGDFAYDVAAHDRGEGFKAISPVFDKLTDFFAWAKAQGYNDAPGHLFTLTKETNHVRI